MPTPPYSPARIEIPIYRASYDGHYWGRYPNGDKPGGMAGGGSIIASASGALSTHAQLAGGASLSAAAMGTLSGGTAGGQIIWRPGWYLRLSASPGMDSLATIKSQMDAAVAADVNNRVLGFAFHMLWSQLETPNAPANLTDATASRYDGSWDTSGPGGTTESGFPKIAAIIAHAKSYNPPRSIVPLLNMGANGLTDINETSYPKWFAPAYLNSPVYAGGCLYYPGNWSDPAIGTVKVIYWNANVQHREAALVQAMYTRFGPDTPTGGIYMVDLFNEVTAAHTSLGNSEFVNNCANILFPAIRSAAPQWMFTARPTFLNGTDAQSWYQPLFNAMIANKIALGDEDMCNVVVGYGDGAYEGLWSGVAQPGWPNYTADTIPRFPHVANIEAAELFQAGNQSTYNNPVPPATKGTGTWYDLPGNPGMMTGVRRMKSSHVIVLSGGYGGPPVNRMGHTGAPANPTPGPGAGLTSALPNIVSVITEDTRYPGIIPGSMAIPSTARPVGY
jgi:hypothetical protein